MTERETPFGTAALGVALIVLGLRLLAVGADLLVEAAGALFAENVTAPAKEGI